jgi:hypothetical protein
MKRTTSTTRRTALKYSAATLVGALTTVAGCMGGGGGNDGGGGNGGGNGTLGQTGQPTEAGTATTPAKTATGTATTGGDTAGPTTMGTTAGTGPTTAGPAQAIKLGGKIAGWMGRAPAAIQSKTNPTLTLQPGTTYRLTWVNLDGAEHELIIEDANGNELVATESSSKKGVTRTVTFQATKQMDQYYCEYHPQSMRGNIRVGGRGTGTAGTETASATTDSGSGY